MEPLLGSQMNFNPLTETISEMQMQIDGLQRIEKQIADELQWYACVDPWALTEDQRRNEGAADKLQFDIQALDEEIQKNGARIAEIAPAIGTLLNPFNWFSKDQADLRRELDQLPHVGKQKVTQRQSKVKELEETRARIVKVARELQRHWSFDLTERQSELSKIKQIIADRKDELAFVAERKRRVDEVLSPLVQEMQNLESKLCHANSDLEFARGFEWQLSSAANSYERAMIHQQCECNFGEASPRKIVGARQKAIRQLERDYEKARRRVEDVAMKAARKIGTIVIDGNNLCYEGRTFIGLSALRTLLPLLSRLCSVVVVFDSAIRRLLNTDDFGIQKRLGSYAKVHIVASRQMADETVLDLVCGNEFAYVLSNDRFGDFNEKSAVRDGRIIRHEIVSGNVFVHDLQLRAAYGESQSQGHANEQLSWPPKLRKTEHRDST